jgi:hypothetical protein
MQARYGAADALGAAVAVGAVVAVGATVAVGAAVGVGVGAAVGTGVGVAAGPVHPTTIRNVAARANVDLRKVSSSNTGSVDGPELHWPLTTDVLRGV